MLRLAFYALLNVVAAGPLLAAPFVPERDAQCVAFSPDGRLVVTGKSGMSNSEFPPRPHPNPRKAAAVEIWDVGTAKKLKRMESYGDVLKVEFSPDSSMVGYVRLYSAGGDLELNEVRIWDVRNGKTVQAFDRCYSFDFHPDGRRCIVLSRSKCVMFEVKSGRRFREFENLSEAISIELSADGQRIAGVMEEDGGFTIRICSTSSGEILTESFVLDVPFFRVAWSPDRKYLATGHPRGDVLLWDVATLDVVSQFRSPNPGWQHPFFSPDGLTLASGSQSNADTIFWELKTGKQIGQYTFGRGAMRTYFPRKEDEKVRPEKDPARFAYSPDGNTFIAGPYGGIIRLVSNGQEVIRFKD